MRPDPLDPKTEALVFIHIPKTGGTSVERQVAAALGAEKVHRFHAGKVENYRYSAFDETAHRALFEVRRAANALRDRVLGDPLAAARERWRDVPFFCAHLRLGDEPDFGRRPRYFALTRRPFERFVSSYSFRMKRLRKGVAKPGPHPGHRPDGAPPDTPEEFFERLMARSATGWRNGQSRFFARSGQARDAIETIERTGALVYPLERMSAAFEALSTILGVRLEPTQENPSRHMLKRETFDPGFREAVEAAFAEDMALHAYVSERAAAHPVVA